jgi:hypothetical protein
LGHESRGTEDSKDVLLEIIYHCLQQIFRFIHSLHFNAKNIKKTLLYSSIIKLHYKTFYGIDIILTKCAQAPLCVGTLPYPKVLDKAEKLPWTNTPAYFAPCINNKEKMFFLFS